ncbi:hypothetical protein CYMTET_32454, partial [Cymbomonas tetramitiformis]
LNQHMDELLPILANCLGLERDAHMRLGLLKVVDQLFEDEERGSAFRSHSHDVVMQLLVAPAVWRSGKTAAAVRYHAIRALGTFLERKLITPEELHGIISQGGDVKLLSVVHTCMEEDYYADTRRVGVYALQQVLLVAGPHLDGEERRQIYPEILKRLDDSNDGIRLATTGCITAFFSTLNQSYDDTNTGYFLDGIIVHMDDADPSIQEGICAALQEAARIKPEVVEEKVLSVRARHRSPVYCDRVLEACTVGKQNPQERGSNFKF